MHAELVAYVTTTGHEACPTPFGRERDGCTTSEPLPHSGPEAIGATVRETHGTDATDCHDATERGGFPEATASALQ